MNIHPKHVPFENISQRVAYSYLRFLSDPEHFPSEDPALVEPVTLAAMNDLHGFFVSLYSTMFASPAVFGLPDAEDACITGIEKDPVQFKQEVTRKMKKPRERIEQGLAYLSLAGQRGCLEGENLRLSREEYAGILKESKVKKPFLQGLIAVGLGVAEEEASMRLYSQRFPAMMPALKRLAGACAQRTERNLARFFFTRCDFQVLDPQYRPGVLELYRVFAPEDYERVVQVHEFLSRLKYKPEIGIYPNTGFEVQYQGRREVKTSPLVRIEYADRYQDPLQVDIKCASTDRLLPHVFTQPLFLQEDFARRALTCQGDKCGWCKTRPHLGPSEFEFAGESRTICWYVNPDFLSFNAETARLVEQYALLHEELA